MVRWFFPEFSGFRPPLMNDRLDISEICFEYGINANMFVKIMWVAFPLQKLLAFLSKNTCELDIVLIRAVKILTTNALVKLKMLWTTGPWSDRTCTRNPLMSAHCFDETNIHNNSHFAYFFNGSICKGFSNEYPSYAKHFICIRLLSVIMLSTKC